MTPDSATIDRFAAFFERTFDDMPTAEVPIALAVSGGADSMAMLVLGAAAFPRGVVVATVDHGLRPSAADECAMVARVCADLGVDHATLHATAPPAGASLQAQARRLRYDLLVDWAAARGALALATAHQTDDQAETLLMRAARGAGLSGLAGVRSVRTGTSDTGATITLVRPLLDWRRAELRAIVRCAELPFVDDPANDDPRHDRTRFRRLLGDNEWLDPSRLARAASHLAEADAELRALADWVWDMRRLPARGTGIEIDVAGLPRGMKRRLTQRAIGVVRENAGIERPDWSPDANIEPLLDALAHGKGATHAGVLARPAGDTWHFREAPPRRPARSDNRRSG